MKKIMLSILCCSGLSILACNNSSTTENSSTMEPSAQSSTGQSGVSDDVSQRNVVQVAAGSKDHTTLVTAIKAAELVNALSNAGPFTVFAPTNAAFDQLPSGTLDGLLKPEKKNDLTDILQYHVSLGVFKTDQFVDGQVIGQVNGDNITISKKADGVYINGKSKIIASIQASNGIIHVVDGVLLPPAK